MNFWLLCIGCFIAGFLYKQLRNMLKWAVLKCSDGKDAKTAFGIKTKSIMLAIWYFDQFFSQMIMLVTMTYNGWIMTFTVLGLTLGYMYSGKMKEDFEKGMKAA